MTRITIILKFFLIQKYFCHHPLKIPPGIKKIWNHNQFLLPDAEIKHKTYRAILLNNDLPVILISDNSTKKSIISISVNTGYYNDPVNLPGMAHYLEHMLFLGTEENPDPSEFRTFISENAGSSNAYTSTLETNYFTVAAASSSFLQVFKRQSDFFVSPK